MIVPLRLHPSSRIGLAHGTRAITWFTHSIGWLAPRDGARARPGSPLDAAYTRTTYMQSICIAVPCTQVRDRGQLAINNYVTAHMYIARWTVISYLFSRRACACISWSPYARATFNRCTRYVRTHPACRAVRAYEGIGITSPQFGRDDEGATIK